MLLYLVSEVLNLKQQNIYLNKFIKEKKKTENIMQEEFKMKSIYGRNLYICKYICMVADKIILIINWLN